MQEQEQKVDKQQELKKAYIGNAIMLFVLLIGIILAVFAWFSSFRDDAVASGIQMYTNDNLAIDYKTVAGTVQSNGSVVYDPIDDSTLNLNSEDFVANDHLYGMIPGEKRYFKTYIYNSETRALTGTVNLQNLLVNQKLQTTDSKVYVSFAATVNESQSQQSFDLSRTTAGYDSTYILIPTQRISQTITLPAAQGEGENFEPSTTVLYWYVVLNGSAVDNDFWQDVEAVTSGYEEDENGDYILDENDNPIPHYVLPSQPTMQIQNIKFMISH